MRGVCHIKGCVKCRVQTRVLNIVDDVKGHGQCEKVWKLCSLLLG